MKLDISLYKVLKRVLGELNQQVVDHGERVAYLYLKIAEYRREQITEYLENMMLACFAHDIGAYKTEKFINLLNFDAKNTEEHCIYGYLFMKYFSPLENDSEVLLYHHSYFEDKNKYDSKYFDDGLLIHMLDRVDIFTIKLGNPEQVHEQLLKWAGINFNPKDVDDFIAADKKYHIIEHLIDGTYKNTVKYFFERKEITNRLLYPVISMLAYEIDFKSEQTVIHTITIVLFAKILGAYFGLTHEQIEEMEMAAIIHDIGKIKIPTEILEKPGKLTFDEYQTIKKHVDFTNEIVSDLFPEKIVKIALNHHERLDGSGYPKGLKGDQLTLQDQIVEIADVLSALIQKRSYKDEFEKELVLKIIKEDTDNGKFDPRFYSIISKNYDQILNDVRAGSVSQIKRYENLNIEYQSYLDTYNKSEHIILDEFALIN